MNSDLFKKFNFNFKLKSKNGAFISCCTPENMYQLPKRKKKGINKKGYCYYTLYALCIN